MFYFEVIFTRTVETDLENGRKTNDIFKLIFAAILMYFEQIITS